MNYIYDILLNYNNYDYDFFEWNNSDTILHIRKIPLIKVSTLVLNDIKNYDIVFDKKFLEIISNKTETFNNKNIRIIEYACLLSDGTNIIAIMLKNNRCLKSKLLLDEEEDVLAIAEKLKEQSIDYKKQKKLKNNIYKTRKQIEQEQKLRRSLKNIFNLDNNETIKYIYYECFNKKENNISVIKNNFYNIFEEMDELKIDRLKNIIKLLEIKH